MTSRTKNQSHNLDKLRELIHGIQYCMMTTVEEDGSLRSRPMYTQEEDFGNDLWFFTNRDSSKVDEIEAERHVNLSYISENQKIFVSVSGQARISLDRDKMKAMWKSQYKAWFPLGLEDPDLALLRVSVDYAEYWDTPSSLLVRLVGLMKVVTGDVGEARLGEHRKIDVSSSTHH